MRLSRWVGRTGNGRNCDAMRRCDPTLANARQRDARVRFGSLCSCSVRFTFVNVESSLTDIGEIVESNEGYKGTRKVSKLRIRRDATNRRTKVSRGRRNTARH